MLTPRRANAVAILARHDCKCARYFVDGEVESDIYKYTHRGYGSQYV
jgi:hypothetical protein